MRQILVLLFWRFLELFFPKYTAPRWLTLQVRKVGYRGPTVQSLNMDTEAHVLGRVRQAGQRGIVMCSGSQDAPLNLWRLCTSHWTLNPLCHKGTPIKIINERQKKKNLGVPMVTWLVSMKTRVWSLASQGSGIAMSCGVGHRHGLDPELLWLWCRPASTALIWSLAWEPPYVMGVALKRQKPKEKEKKEKRKVTGPTWQQCWGCLGLHTLMRHTLAILSTVFPISGCLLHAQPCANSGDTIRTRLRSGIVVAVAQAGTCSSDSTPKPGNVHMPWVQP